MTLLAPGDLQRMPWPTRARRMHTWRLLVDEYARVHHDTYHVTKRTRRPSCSCPWGRP